MSDSFSFQQFTIRQDRTSMKVGTDSVLLGAWTEIADARHLLDIGAGTGILSLMLAQRNQDAIITGVEYEVNAYQQALENVAASPWADRIHLVHKDIRDFSPPDDKRYDLIVSNPPYHRAQVTSPDSRRHLARHADALPFEDLLKAVDRLIHPHGHFTVILPSDAAGDFIALAYRQQLYLEHRTHVISREGKPPKRVLLRFGKENVTESLMDELVLETADGVRTEAMRQLTGDFYR